MSFFYEGDLLRLNGGVLIEKRIKKRLLYSDFTCDLLINHKTYPCNIHIPILGGYAVRDILKDKDELLDYVFNQLKNDNHFLLHFYVRWGAKLLLRIAGFILPIFIIYMYKYISLQRLIFAIIFMIFFEFVIFVANGILNKL